MTCESRFHSSAELIAEIKQGHMVILVDDEDRENEGDLVLAADFVTTAQINFMVKEARGLVCLAMTEAQIKRLELPLMVREDMNFSPNGTAFTVSIEASSGVSTGISAADRAHTIRVASNPQATASDVQVPGHVFPIRAKPGGVIKRPGHTEGSVDLARLAGLNPAAVICEVMNEDGSMSRVSDLFAFAKKFNLKIGTIVELIEYRLERETLVEESLSQPLPAPHESITLKVFRSNVDGLEHLVLQKGVITPDEPTTVRVQVMSIGRELQFVLSLKKSPWQWAFDFLDSTSGPAVCLFLASPLESSQLTTEMKNLFSDPARASFAMDSRDYGIGAQILKCLNVHKIRLVTAHPERKIAIRGFQLEIVESVPLNEKA